MGKFVKSKKEINKCNKILQYFITEYGKKVCKDLHPDCKNCQAQWALGWLRDHIDTLEWWIEQDEKEKKEKKK